MGGGNAGSVEGAEEEPPEIGVKMLDEVKLLTGGPEIG